MDQQGEIVGLFPNVLARKVWNEGNKFNLDMKHLFYQIEKKFPMDSTSFNLTDHYYTSYNKVLDKQLIEYDEMKPFVNFLSDNVRYFLFSLTCKKNNLLTIPIITKNFRDPVINILLFIEFNFCALSLEELIIYTFQIIFENIYKK